MNMKSLVGGYRSSVVNGKLIITDSIVQNVINTYLHDTRKEHYLNDTNVKQKVKISKDGEMFLKPQSLDLDESLVLCDILEKTEESTQFSENNNDIVENKNETDEEEEQEQYNFDNENMENEEELQTSCNEDTIV